MGGALGWAAVAASRRAAFRLYVGGIAWTLGYDTIYAHQDKDDDLLIGLKSSALALGAWTRPFLFIFYAAAVVPLGHRRRERGLRVALSHRAWPVRRSNSFGKPQQVDTSSQPDCSRKFRSNRWTGWILLVGIVAAHVL